MEFYRLERPNFRWGDYGDILLHGMATRDNATGLLLLERTGNFVPPISFPGMPGIIVTNEFREAIESSSLGGFSFQGLLLQHIVDLDWRSWDATAEEPAFYPSTGEPEDYILTAEHSNELTDQMPALYELLIAETAHVERIEDPSAEYGVRISLLRETWNGDDFFRTPEVLFEFVTEDAKQWLEENVGEFVRFESW